MLWLKLNLLLSYYLFRNRIQKDCVSVYCLSILNTKSKTVTQNQQQQYNEKTLRAYSPIIVMLKTLKDKKIKKRNSKKGRKEDKRTKYK